MSDETCWSLIERAAAGDAVARGDFSRRYLPVVRAYLAARWRGRELGGELDDAVQEVFLDFFRKGGLLERIDPEREGGFRALLFGVARTAALHFETRFRRHRDRHSPEEVDPDGTAAEDERLSRVFDRAWARSLMREAAERQALHAKGKGQEALERVELLRLRFHEGMPIRDIATLWRADAAHLHRAYAEARDEFLECLREVVGLHERCSRERLQAECDRLLDLLSSG